MTATPAYIADMEQPAQAPTLAKIVNAARAGSLDYAIRLFRSGGFHLALGDPAALAVAGRLAKDRALRHAGADRAALMAEAAGAYGRAFALDPQPYTRINEATCTLLAGDTAGAQAIARELLALLDSGARIAETPYYIIATRAEALLLLGDRAGAEARVAQAKRLAIDCPEDQASTLRQLSLILEHRHAERGWLDAYRPRRALNFAGHLALAETAIAPLETRLRTVLTQNDVGAGFGALAAGSDLVIAEALLDIDAELHVVLPTTPDSFMAQSVVPYGARWVERFARCLDAATTVRWVSSVSGEYEPLAIHLAADVAMGASIMHAKRRWTTAIQLLIIDDAGGPFGGGRDTAYLGERWRAGTTNGAAMRDRRQICLIAPRSTAVAPSGSKPPEGRADRCLTAMLHIAFDGFDTLEDGAFAEALDTVIAPFRRACDALEPQPDVVLPAGNARIVAFHDPDAAWRHAAALLALPETAGRLRVVGHYGLAHWLGTPAALVGTSVGVLTALAPVAMPGVLIASEALASAVFVNQADLIHGEEIGEWRGDKLFALAPLADSGADRTADRAEDA
jgi:hypothetical protein